MSNMQCHTLYIIIPKRRKGDIGNIGQKQAQTEQDKLQISPYTSDCKFFFRFPTISTLLTATSLFWAGSTLITQLCLTKYPMALASPTLKCPIQFNFHINRFIQSPLWASIQGHVQYTHLASKVFLDTKGYSTTPFIVFFTRKT